MIKSIQTLFCLLVVVVLFFSLVQPVNAMKLEKYDWNLTSGWNFIAPPVATKTTAQQVCKQNPLIFGLAKWVPSSDWGTWLEYECANPIKANNFILEANIGYFVRATSPITLSLKGDEITTPPAEIHNWFLGANSIGLSYANNYSLLAQNLCGNLTDTTFQVSEVIRWKNGGWDSHLCSGFHPVPVFNNFPIVKGEGYVLRVTSQ